ncbi:hypothetical protein [Dactylosporangium sp. CA-139066]|uniref:hypothetical protein n=1 Tax=Dactylosporangium sp. CA-139066 TaxID=3239930 RepID=UPI003D8E5CD5
MTAVLEPVAVSATVPTGTLAGPDVDPDCPKCGTCAAVVYVGATTETVYELGEQPGPKHAWSCRTCSAEWTTLASEPVDCPAALSWCVSHEADHDGAQHHAGAMRAASYDLDGFHEPTPGLLVVGATRDERPDGTVDPVVWVDPSSQLKAETYGFSPAAARELAMALLAAAAEASGSKRADDLRIGDRIVLDGRVHVVRFLMVDACHCDDVDEPCDGTVQVYTDLSEAVDETSPAATFDPADLAEVAP